MPTPPTYDSSSNCPHCSRAPYAGHHPDCPEHTDKKPKPIELDQVKFDALLAAWKDVPNGTVVPDRVASWLQPLINAVTSIVDPTGALGATDVQSVTQALGEDPDQSQTPDEDEDELIDEDPTPTMHDLDAGQGAQSVSMADRVDEAMTSTETDPAKPE